jgi:hypothetical protein
MNELKMQKKVTVKSHCERQLHKFCTSKLNSSRRNSRYTTDTKNVTKIPPKPRLVLVQNEIGLIIKRPLSLSKMRRVQKVRTAAPQVTRALPVKISRLA